MRPIDVLRAVFPRPMRRPLRRLYNRVPLKIRIGRDYWKLRRFLDEAQWWDRVRIEAWQLTKLQETVRYAYTHVSGYHELYRDAGVTPEDIRSLHDVRHLPLTTKDLLRSNVKEFTARNMNGDRLLRVSSSGSTGEPFSFYRTDVNRWMELAFLHTGWAGIGWRLGDVSVVLRGGFVGTEGHMWGFDSEAGNLKVSSYHVTDENYALYVDKIKEFNALHMQAYPSAAVMLADLVLDHDDVGDVTFKTILMGSENVYPWQLNRLRDAFPDAHIHVWYGHSEQAVLAPWCEKTEQYHVWPFYGVTEIIDGNDREVEAGQSGEVIATSFWNYAVPFIRYRTMDRVRKGKVGCSACGRQFQILDAIEGRLQEIVVAGSGRHVALTGLSVLTCFDNVRQCQFYQDTPGRVTLKVVRKDRYTDDDTSTIREAVLHNLGESMELDIVFVDGIKRSGSGKLSFLEQKLKIKPGD